MGTKNKNLLVAFPVYRQIDVYTMQSIIRLMTAFATHHPDWGLGIDFHAGECPIGRARNDLTHRFLQNKEFTHILFVDADIIYSFEQVEKILSHDEDIVGGFYPKKSEGPVALVCNRLDTVDAPNDRGLVKTKYMGTGFLRISRKVFEVMIQEMGKDLEYVCDSGSNETKHDFWRMGVVKGADGKNRWLSEDWQFCQFALDCGFEVWGDAQIMLQHSGMAIYPLSYQIVQLYGKEAAERMISKAKAQDGAGAVPESPPPAPAQITA